MGIESENFVMHLAAAMNQTAGAGGKMSNITVAENVPAAVVDDISEAERTAGGERKYKVYHKVGNADNKTYQNAMLYLGYPLEGGNVSSLIKGNFTDSWSEVSGNRKYGCANLKAATSLTAGDVTAVVNTRGQSYAHFQTGDTVAVFDQFNPEDI
ncbi:MAG: hypothetical protein GY862_22525, partial [Gammaproteobacteria bacterium]|nr:hypothetical protein [Gammaproteobacteria bacterium]